MTEYTPKPGENPVPPEEEKAADITKEVYAQWTQGERLMGIGAAIILVVNLLIGEIIMGEYGLSNSSWLIPLAILVAQFVYYRGKQAQWHSFYPWMIEVGGWAMLAIGVVTFLGSLINGFPSGSGLLFALIFIGATVIIGVGAYMIHQDRNARY